MILGAVGVMGASPATAGVVSCSGQGVATLTAGIGLPPSSKTVGFNLQSTVAVCSDGGASFSAAGTLTGACGLGSGNGNATLGNHAPVPFSFQSASSVLVVSGGAVGTINLVADPTVANNSCTTGTATKFLATVVLAHR